MKITETTYTVSKSGGLKIPSSALKEMGLTAGDHVRVAYLTSDGVRNDCREFLISGEALTEADEGEAKIGIPAELLAQANIPQDTDLQIVCCNGCIIITRDATMSTEDLAEVCAALRTTDEIIRQLPPELGTDDLERGLREAVELAAERSADK